LVGLIAGMLWD